MSVDEQISLLRQELKSWEKNFAAQNGGRKAGREDIKRDPAIAAKYKEYDQLRRPRQTAHQSPNKRTNRLQHTSSPSKRRPDVQPIAATPTKRAQKLSFKSPEQPLQAREPSPTPQAIRQRLGPTPQKDGQILGLFDSFSTTPSKPREALSSIDANVAATPSKGDRNIIIQSPDVENARLSRTPASSGKRFLLDAFATPLKRKRDEEQPTPSGARGSAETPAFLRRIDIEPFSTRLGTLTETEEPLSLGVREPPFKKRGLVRSLSAIIRNLKQQEEEDADEDLAMMREMEAEEAGGPPSVRPSTIAKTPPPEILVENSQIEMPLGPDGEINSDEEDDDDNANDGLDANGQPRRVWKKKGQKRTTRRVIMRPAPRLKATESQQTTSESQIVHETQLPDAIGSDVEFDAGELDEDSDDEYNASTKSKITKPESQSQQKDSAGPIKKAVRKISAAAHANYCKLKIKNKNSKAKGRGRFSRR
ncbi:hypothetical protein MBLNU457_2307t1 [Dothideomycetes sp. NU457]